jgi:hypothetical protein
MNQEDNQVPQSTGETHEPDCAGRRGNFGNKRKSNKRSCGSEGNPPKIMDEWRSASNMPKWLEMSHM